MMGIVWLGRSSAHSGQRVVVNTKLTVNPQCALAAEKAKSFLSCIRQGCQQMERGDPSPISDISGVLCPVLDFLAQERHGCIEAQRVMRMSKGLEDLWV